MDPKEHKLTIAGRPFQVLAVRPEKGPHGSFMVHIVRPEPRITDSMSSREALLDGIELVVHHKMSHEYAIGPNRGWGIVLA